MRNEECLTALEVNGVWCMVFLARGLRTRIILYERLGRYTVLARLRRIAAGCPDHNLVHTHNLVRQPMCVVRVLIIAMRVLVRQVPMCCDRAAVVSRPAALRPWAPVLLQRTGKNFPRA